MKIIYLLPLRSNVFYFLRKRFPSSNHLCGFFFSLFRFFEILLGGDLTWNKRTGHMLISNARFSFFKWRKCKNITSLLYRKIYILSGFYKHDWLSYSNLCKWVSYKGTSNILYILLKENGLPSTNLN